jgi:hypothetical protein
MPYIQDHDRERVIGDGPKNAGELNYALTELVIEYMERTGKCYNTMNDIMGALEGCKLEFYRRVTAPYEDKKIEENGDVY